MFIGSIPTVCRITAATLSLAAVAHGGEASPPSEPASQLKLITTRAAAANRIAEKPDYAHSLNSDVSWLDFGIESRTRYEYRWNDYGSLNLLTDDALVTRNLLYLGIRNGLGPLCFALELEDSRRFLSERRDDPRIMDDFDLLQGYVQLHFDDVAGNAPLSLSFGRMAFDWVDRRLISRNRNRNTINAFDGFRLCLGSDAAPWEVDAIAVRPVERSIHSFDESSSDARLFGLSGYWRDWSPNFIIEPYWLWLDQSHFRDFSLRRDLQTIGVHTFGQWGQKSAWDHDLSLAGQWGKTQNLDHRAWAGHAEVGRTFAWPWKPRLGLWLNYASGDHHSGDGSNERFDPLFGASYAFYGYTNYFALQNLISPALRFSFQPAPKFKCELIHRLIWLDSDTDVWPRALRRDPTGGSGSYVGQEADARLAWQLCQNFDIDLAYAHFFPGNFTDNTGASPASDFVQVAATLRF